MDDLQARCGLCGEPMPPGEEMFKFHGYSGPCPKPPLLKQPNETESGGLSGKDRAYWLADKITACGDYAKESAVVLRKQADEIENLREQLNEAHQQLIDGM